METPHIVKKKNRADLMISIDAFERFHLDNPPIDRYIFVTSDSDFSVIMDKLRSYGKEVWMIGPKADQAKKLLARCCDLLLSIEVFIRPLPLRRPQPPLTTWKRTALPSGSSSRRCASWERTACRSHIGHRHANQEAAEGF